MPAHTQRSPLDDIEEALFAHWAQFGLWARGELVEEGGLLRYATPISALPYNGVIRTRLGSDADDAIAAVRERYRPLGADFVWFVHPSATPADLGERLEAQGVRPREPITCMWLDLDRGDPAPTRRFSVAEVLDDAAVATYTDLTVRYWEIPEEQRELVAELHRGWTAGRRFLAYDRGRPVGKGYLSLAGPAGVAAIFGMSVVPEARGRGVASALTAALVNEARSAGYRRVVLHSTAAAAGVYLRAGFTECCPLVIHATAALWADH